MKQLSIEQRLDMAEMYIKAKGGCEKSYMDLVSCCWAYNHSNYDTSYFDNKIIEEILPLYKNKLTFNGDGEGI